MTVTDRQNQIPSVRTTKSAKTTALPLLLHGFLRFEHTKKEKDMKRTATVSICDIIEVKNIIAGTIFGSGLIGLLGVFMILN